MEKMKNIFFMLLIAMTIICGAAVNAAPEASPAANSPDTQASAAPSAEPDAKPSPEATVAPELADNQVAVKEGATDLIFTVTHKDTIDVSVSSPKNVVLDTANPRVSTKSVTGGTEVHISQPEAGIWTMNASSMSGEELTVKGAVMYNFDVELQSEKGVIYSGVPNKFIAFVKSKDGSKIDPDILRTATMNLIIKEDGSEKPKEIPMTFKGAAFEITYTHNKVERISVSALAVINEAEVQSNSLEIISIVDPNQSKGVPIGIIILIVVVITGVGVVLYIKLSDKMKNTKGVKNMSGNLTINISVNGDEKLPITRNLAMLGMSAGMLSIIGDDEYYDVDGITVSGIDKGVRVVNKSRCEVRFSNVSADPAGVNLFDEQYFKIFMPDDKTVITVTYHSGDIFSGLVNNTASEQQKQMEQSIAEQQETAAVTAEELYKEFDKPEETAAPEQEPEQGAAPSEPEQTEQTEQTSEPEQMEQTEAPVLETLNLSEVTEDAVPEVQEEKAEEISDEAVEEMSSFTIDTTDAEEIAPAPDADEDYTPETAPALESFSFDMSDTVETELITDEQKPEEAEQTAPEVASFTIDTTDAEEIAPAPDADEDYTPETAPALESFSFNIEDTSENADNAAQDNDVSDSQPQTSIFGDLASLANEVAASEAEASADETDIEQNSGIDFGDLASLAADAVAAEETEKKTDTAELDDTEDLFDLQHLADELTKE